MHSSDREKTVNENMQKSTVLKGNENTQKFLKREKTVIESEKHVCGADFFTRPSGHMRQNASSKN